MNKEKRIKTKCPIKTCQKRLYNLPRHMRCVHNWSDMEAKNVKGLYGLRKPYKYKNSTMSAQRKSHYHKQCPIYGCRSVVINLSRHLQRSHNMSRFSNHYKDLLKKAITIDIRSKKHQMNPNSPAKSDNDNQSNVSLNVLHGELMESDSNDLSFYPKDDFKSSMSDCSNIATDEKDSSKDDSTHSNSSTFCEPKNFKLKTASVTISEDRESIHCLSNSENENSKLDDDLYSTSENDSDLHSIVALNHNLKTKKIFNDFMEFLVSPDSGNRDCTAAELCVNNVKRILIAISDDKFILQSLLDRQLVRDIFLKKYCKEKNMHPKTIQKYIKSLEHFFSFVLSENVEEFALLKTEIESFKCKLKMWSRSYVKESKIAAMSKMEQERKNKITPQDIRKFENSEIVCETITMLGYLDEGKKVKISRSFFTNVRDLLITEIFIDNGHRAGVLSNMTMKEYQSCETLSEGNYCITVYKHKQAKAGPIRVILGLKLHKWLSLYVTHLRSAVTNDCTPSANVFVTWNGQSFHCSGGISMASNALWKKAGMTGRCGANKLRKAVVSAVRESNLSSEQMHTDLANLMGHTKATADRYYYIEEKLKSAGRAAGQLPIVMRATEAMSDKQSRDTSDTCKLVKHAKHKFSLEEINDLQLVYSDELDNDNISMNGVMEKLIMLKSKNLSGRQVYDKLKTLSRNAKKNIAAHPVDKEENCQIMSINVPVETLSQKMERMNDAMDCSSESDSELIPPSFSDRSCANGKFLAKDVIIINELFAEVIKKGSCKDEEISALLTNNADGKKLLKKFAVCTIKNRIKYEIRKRKPIK